MYLPGITVNSLMAQEEVPHMLYLNAAHTDMPLRGEVNNLVIFIRFQGEVEFKEPITMYDRIFNSSAVDVDSVYNFFNQTSYSQLKVTSTFYSKSGTSVVSYEDSHPRAYYEPYNATTNTMGYTNNNRAEREVSLIKNAILSVKTEIENTNLNLDINNDGEVDSVTFVVSGPIDKDYWGKLLAPHYASIEGENIQLKGKKVEYYTFMIEDMFWIGLIVHEMLHQMEFVDLYKYGSTTENPIWTWDTMGVSTFSPANTCAYTKWRYGEWINDIPKVTLPQHVTLLPLTQQASGQMNCCKIETSNPKQYLILEYRKKTQVGMDSDLPGTGLLIYRVNEEQDEKGNVNGPPWELYLFRPGGSPTSDGEKENAYLSSESGRTEAGNASFPLFFEDGTDMGIRITNVGPAGDTISFDVAYASVNTADLSLTARASAATINQGQELTYTIVITNAGPDTAQRVVLSDRMPTALTDVQFSLNNGTTWAPWPTAYILGDMTSGATRTLLIRGTVSNTATGTITNTAVVSSSTLDPNPANNTAMTQTNIAVVTPTADLRITKMSNAATIAPGQELTYAIVVSNVGPDTAQRTVLSDIVPVILNDIEFSIDNGANWAAWKTPYVIGNMESGASRSILIRGTVSGGATGTITNTATVSSSTIDPNPVNNTATVQTEIVVAAPIADLGIIKRVSANTVSQGQQLTYTLIISNAGPDAAQRVVLSDAVPTALTDVQFSIDNGMNWSAWTTPYALGNMPSNATRTILIRGTVSNTATGSITNTATVSSATTDPNEVNNTATIQTSIVAVTPTADLSITKRASATTVSQGQELIYTLSVANAGPDTAQGVVVRDAVPTALMDTQLSTDDGETWSAWTTPYALGNMASGAARRFLIKGTVSPAATGNIINTAVVSSSTVDPNEANNTVTVQTGIIEVPSTADLSITKRASSAAVSQGQQLTYTIVVSNLGPSAAQSVVVNDIVPSELTAVQYSVSNGMTWLPWTTPYVLGNMASGSTRTILLRGTVSNTAAGRITNTAVVSSSTVDPNEANNTATVQTSIVPVTPTADLVITKRASAASITQGDILTYTLVVSNLGPSTAQGVVVRDAVPESLTDVRFSVDNGMNWLPWTTPYVIGNMINGSIRTLLIRGTVSSNIIGTIRNTATVSSATADPNEANNTATVQTNIIGTASTANLRVTKTASASTVSPGQELMYVIEISNLGPATAQRVSLIDMVSVSLYNVQFSMNNGMTWEPWIIPYVVGDIPSGSSETILIRGIVSPNAIGNIINTATVRSATVDPNLVNNRAQTIVNVIRNYQPCEEPQWCKCGEKAHHKHYKCCQDEPYKGYACDKDKY